MEGTVVPKGESCINVEVKLNGTCNELQLVVPPEYRLEAMCGAHDDVGT